MILEQSLKIKHYKCFGGDAQGFEKIYPINVIIGKNNSGKSSLIDLVRYCCGSGREQELIKSTRNGNITKIVFPNTITPTDQNKAFAGHPDTMRRISDLSYEIEIGYDSTSGNVNRDILNPSREITPDLKNIVLAIVAHTPFPLGSKSFKSVSAERNIIKENATVEMKIDFEGNGATSLVQLILNNTKFDSRLVNRQLLNELNKILLPDIKFTDIVTKYDDSNKWEIYFEEGPNGFIPLSKMGSGLKTVLLVLLNLLILPKIENVKPSDYVFAFEELENNLHPALLRRLFSYIIDYSEKNNCYIFITTHSNVVIDIFGAYENAQLIHVTNRGDQSICSTVNTHAGNKKIIEDLDIRASDLLQSNGIVWVEGPSDRIYINKWLNTLNPILKEGLHYSILFYGGRLLSNLTFDYEWLDHELIPLLKINHNAFVVIDRDGQSESARLNETKKRIQSEIGENNCWITEGREIENYLSDAVLQAWLKRKFGEDLIVQNSKNEKLGDILNSAVENSNYDKNKRSFAVEISEHISANDLNVLDLMSKMTNLIQAVKQWNSLD